MKRSLVVLTLASLMLGGIASAEVRQGDVFMDLVAGWTRQNFEGGGDIDVFFGAIRPGMAFTDNIRASVLGAVLHVEEDVTDLTAWTIGFAAEYVFMPANIFNPYIGVQVAWADADLDGFDIDGFLFGPRFGFLYTLNRANNLFGEFQWQLWSGDIGDFIDDGFMVVFGIEHKFKVGQ
jgi:hypothetical protein